MVLKLLDQLKPINHSNNGQRLTQFDAQKIALEVVKSQKRF